MSSLKCQLIIRNLSKHTTSKQLQQYASRFGPIIDCYLTGNACEAFLEFNDRTSVDVFMNKRPHYLEGNQLQCQRCLPSFELQKSVKRIFLRGPIQQLTENRLSNYFDKYGKVISCTIPKGKRNNTFTHFGYAFVAFDDEDVVDRIIQDKPHFIDDIELEVEKAEDLIRNRRSRSRSPISPNNHGKRLRRDTPSPPPPPSSSSLSSTAAATTTSIKRYSRSNDEFTIRQLEEEIHRLREHAIMAKHHFDETIWRLRRELDDERRRYEQLKLDYDYVRRDLTRLTSEYHDKSSTRYNNTNSKSSRH